MNNETLHSQILDFYDGAVTDHYATRCIEFYEQKKKRFSWLFGDQDRIKLSISDLDAADFFFSHNQDFKNLYHETNEFLKKTNSPLVSRDLEMAIFKNRIQYQKNQFKFSKFYNRHVKTEEMSEFNFQSFYDKFKTAECILSIHPLDFLGASANASFSSCLSINSCHHAGCSAYLRDDYTIIAFTTIDGRKLGRQWLYFDGYYMIMGNIYGCITLPMQNMIRELVEEKYAQYLRVPNKWIVSRDKSISEDWVNNCGHGSNDHEDYSVYFDLDVNARIRHKEKTSNFGDLYLDFQDGLDKYGDDTNSGHIGLNYCACCDASIEGESTYTEDGEVCDYCLNEHYTFCYECDRYFYEEHTMYYIENEDHYICESCYDNGDYGYCEMTEAYYTSDNLVELIQSDGTIISVYKDYAEEHYHICDICGKYHEEPLTQIPDEQLVCNKCLKDDYELVDGSYVLKSEHAA